MRREPSFDAMDWDDDEPGLRRLRRPRRFAKARFAARFVLAAALIAALTLAAKNRMPLALGPETAAEAPRATASLARAAAARPEAGPLLALESTEGELPTRPEPPRWSPATGLREDALTGGGFDAIEAPFLRVTMTETVPSTDTPASLFVTLARRAAEMQGLAVIRTGVRGQVETKFGPFEIVEATLSGHGQRSCTGFQSMNSRAVRIDGWLCGVLGQPPEPRALACAVDRLALSGQAAPTVETVFAEAQTRRLTGCDAGQAQPAQRGEATGSIGRRKAEKAGAKGRLTKK